MEFNFEIGEILQPIIAPDTKLMVLDRNFQECSGGIQISYTCSMSIKSVGYWTTGKGNQIFREIELEKWRDD